MLNQSEAYLVVMTTDVVRMPVPLETNGDKAKEAGEFWLAAAWFDLAANKCGGHNRAERLHEKAARCRELAQEASAMPLPRHSAHVAAFFDHVAALCERHGSPVNEAGCRAFRDRELLFCKA